MVRVFVQEALLAFPQPRPVLDVVENAPPGTLVGQIKLQAPQRRSNLQVQLYPVKVRRLLAAELADNASLVTVVTREPLDHETTPSLKFRVMVTDPASLEAVTAHATLFVKNVNDNAPVFKQKIYSLTAPLTTRRFESVGGVTAVDPDGDQVVYRAVRKGGPFVVVPQTGQILLADTPDQRMYLLQMVAADNRHPPLTSKPILVYISFEEEETEDTTSANATEAHSRVKRRVTRAVRPTKRNDLSEADGEPEGKVVFQLEKESEHETFKIRCVIKN